jgi:hypothetical protein
MAIDWDDELVDHQLEWHWQHQICLLRDLYREKFR